MFLKKIRSRLAAMELKNTRLESKIQKMEERIFSLEEKLKKMGEVPPAEELTKEQIEAMERQLYEWQNGAEDER